MIKDNGCVIPEEYLHDIYDPSFPLKGPKDITDSYGPGIEGTGYGLVNVKNLLSSIKGLFPYHPCRYRNHSFLSICLFIKGAWQKPK
jgi:hypothetical protein